MKDRNPSRRFPLYVALCILLLASATLAQNGVTNRGVYERMTNMAQAQTGIETLTNMMAGRIRFDRVLARDARRNLIKATRDIPSVFKKPHSDRLSRARPDIWIRWDDFKIRADSAKRTARRLNIARLETLRSTLPDMINACLSCHETYRKPR